MHRRLVPGLIMGATLTLAGCGGGDGDGNQPKAVVGYLAVGGVSGVHYATATQSGDTDVTGAFRYVPGETVRFSVGGIELGSVPGASQVTPFTLAGATPATTEPALRRELDRATRGPTPFLRAVNITHFLMAFDADGSPVNGFDVTAAGSVLANATLDFNQGLFAFAPAVNRLPGEKNQNIPSWRPVEHLYRAIGVSVPAHMPRLEQVRGGIVGLYPGSNVSYMYRSDGLRESTSQDSSLDGTPEYSYRVTYDSMGRNLSSHTQWADFFTGFISDSTTEYDARGRYLRQVSRTDYLGDGTVDSSYLSEVVGDRFTGVQRQTTRFDENNDGVVDQITVSEASTDAARRVETYRARIDSNADGIFETSYEDVYTFDPLLRIVLQTEARDDNADGTVDYRTREAFTYSDAPRTGRSEYSEDIGGDGTIERTRVIVRSFDAVGNELSRLTESDNYGGDGVIDDRSRLEYTYDGDRRVLTSKRTLDYSADGITDWIELEFFTYGQIGNILTARNEFDSQGDGVSDYRSERRSEYGPDGELTGWMEFNLQTSATDPLRWMTAENIVMADGVRALAQNYFEFNAMLAF